MAKQQSITCSVCNATRSIDINYEGPLKCKKCGHRGFISLDRPPQVDRPLQVDRPPQVIYVQQPQNFMSGVMKIAMGIILAIIALAFL
jgi:hypothetical protein